MKFKHYITLLLILLFISTTPTLSQAQAPEGKVAVLFSKTSEDYANAIRPGGKVNGTVVSIKEDWSSIRDKELKLFHLYKQQGFQVEKIYEKDLNSIQKLHEYDSIVFSYSVLMNQTQRENVKSYIRDGGGAIFAYGTARNETSMYPAEGKMDMTALIYHTKTWIWEWDNLSDVFQSAFVNDVVLKNYTIQSTNVQHPILTASYKELGKDKLELKNTRLIGDWIEVIAPWNNTVQPLLVYKDYSNSSSPIHTPKNSTGAVYAFEHGKGRMVFTGFKIFDHLQIDANADWEDATKGSAYAGTTGDRDAQVLLKQSLNWVMADHTTDKKRNYEVTLNFTDLRGYLRAADYSIYGSTTVQNKGNVPVRGTLRVEVIQEDGKVLTSYERYLPGLSPDNKSTSVHAEKFHLTLPKNLATGTYQLRTIFIDGRENQKGIPVKAETKTFIKNSANANFKSVAFFKDVNSNNAMFADIRNLSQLRIIRGYPDGTFKPNQSLTRIQATEMILRAAGISVSQTATMAATDSKKGDYGYAVLATGVQNGVITIQNGAVRGYSPMTRNDMAQALVNGFRLQGMSSHVFKDISTTNPNNTYIQTLYSLGITTGYTADNTYRPNISVTRGQFSAFINRSIKANSK